MILQKHTLHVILVIVFNIIKSFLQNIYIDISIKVTTETTNMYKSSKPHLYLIHYHIYIILSAQLHNSKTTHSNFDLDIRHIKCKMFKKKYLLNNQKWKWGGGSYLKNRSLYCTQNQ